MLASLFRQTRCSAVRSLTTAATSSSVKAAPIVNPVVLSLSASILPTKASSEDRVVLLDLTVFNHPIRRDILHLCAVHHLDGLRQGTASTKNRGEVRGSGRKIMQQKGTGKARVGDAQSPIRRGGGVVFGPRPRDFSTKLPRKVLEMGMRVALSARIREHSFGIVDELKWNAISTKTLAARLHQLGIQKTLFVTGAEDRNLQLSLANLPMVEMVRAEDLTVYEALKWQRLILDVSAVEYFEKTLAKPIPTITLE